MGSLRFKRLTSKLRGFVEREPSITKGALSDSDLVTTLGRDDPVLLEIGCNAGQDTQRFLDLFIRGSIYCFEPDPRARKRFRATIQDDRVQLFDVAISNSNGVTEFYASSGNPSEEAHEEMPEGWDLSGSIKQPKNHLERHPWCQFDSSFQVETMTLDTWCTQQEIDRIDFIWADVQGAEKDLIQGARETLKRTRFFYTEYSDQELYEGQLNFKQLVKLLPGFRVIRRYTHDVLFANKLDSI